MPIRKTKFQRPESDSEYDDLLVYDENGKIIKEPPVNEPRTVNCCQCNTATSWCVPEQIPGAVVTTVAAQTLAYLFG